MNNVDYVNKEFILEFVDRISKLEKYGYCPKKIGKIIKYPSKIDGYLKILKKIDLDQSKKDRLNKKISNIRYYLDIDKSIYIKYLEKLNNSQIDLFKKITNNLDNYLEIIFFGNVEIGKQITKIDDIEIIEYFSLISNSGDRLSSIFPYRKIMIVKKGNKFNILKADKHLSKDYEEVLDLKEFERQIDFIKNEINKQIKIFKENELLEIYILFLFRSIYPLIMELGINDTKKEKIHKSLFKNY
jgi:hypothetical protein